MLHDPKHEARSKLPALPIGFIGDDDSPISQPAELIQRTIPKYGTGILGGQSGGGKSFLACNLAIAVSAGLPFMSRDIREPAGVVYYAAEGGGTIKQRLRAAKMHAGINVQLPYTYSDNVGDLGNDENLTTHIQNLKSINLYFERYFGVSLGLVVIDTVSMAFSIRDENSNAEIVSICKVLKRIQEAANAFVCAVHHLGKDQSAGLRGGSAWRGNVDSVLMCLADRNEMTGECQNRRLTVSKHRDGPEGPIGSFELNPFPLGLDDRGESFGTCVINFTGEAAVNTKRKESASQSAFREAFNEVVLQGGGRKFQVHGDGPHVEAVRVEAVRQEFFRRWATGEEDQGKRRNAARMAFQRALKEPCSPYGKEVANDEELIWKL